MKTIEINAYTYAELTPEAQERARDWYRECSAGDTYYSEYVQEDAREIAKRLGYEVKDIYWSGFWSQGHRA